MRGSILATEQGLLIPRSFGVFGGSGLEPRMEWNGLLLPLASVGLYPGGSFITGGPIIRLVLLSLPFPSLPGLPGGRHGNNGMLLIKTSMDSS